MPSDENRQDEPWTIGKLLNWTTDYLRRRGSESPRLDAEGIKTPGPRGQVKLHVDPGVTATAEP